MSWSHIECDTESHIQRDDVTSHKVKHSSSVQSTAASSWIPRLYHGNRMVVYTNIDSPIGAIEKLSVDVVPSRGGHSQFSVVVRHAAC